MMQWDAHVAACVDSMSGTLEGWGRTRQVLALALYVGETVRRSKGTAGDWDPDTDMHMIGKVMAMVEYGVPRAGIKGHTIRVVSPQASATGATHQGVTDLVQNGHTWWAVEPKGDRRAVLVYTAALLKRVEHPLIRWVREAEGVGVGTEEKVHAGAILRALESEMDRNAEKGDANDIKQQIRIALEWVAGRKEGNQPIWTVPPGTEEEARKEALGRARRLMEEAKHRPSGAKEKRERGRQRTWRGLRRGRGG